MVERSYHNKIRIMRHGRLVYYNQLTATSATPKYYQWCQQKGELRKCAPLFGYRRYCVGDRTRCQRLFAVLQVAIEEINNLPQPNNIVLEGTYIIINSFLSRCFVVCNFSVIFHFRVLWQGLRYAVRKTENIHGLLLSDSVIYKYSPLLSFSSPWTAYLMKYEFYTYIHAGYLCS